MVMPGLSLLSRTRGHATRDFRTLLPGFAEAYGDRLLPTLHFRPEPLLSVPFFLRRIADLTRLPAALPYLAMSWSMQVLC
jgi:hypothetical protein